MPIFDGSNAQWQDEPFSHPFLKAWLDNAVDIIDSHSTEYLLGLSPQTKRSLATAVLCYCQSIMGLSVDDLMLKSGSDEAYEGYLKNLRMKTVDSCQGEGTERLITAFKLTEKSCIALGRSDHYNELIEQSAQMTLRTIERHKPEFEEWKINEHGNFPYGFVIAGMQAFVWKDAAPELFRDLTDFRVFAAQPGQHTNRYFREKDGSGFFFIDSNSDKNWEHDPEKSGWLIAHEHLHHVQHHMLDKLKAGKLAAGHPLYEDARNLEPAKDYGVLTIGSSFLPKDGNEAPGIDVWSAIQDALYLARPDEQATFALHNRIQELLVPQAERPLPDPAPTARPSRAPR